MSMVVHQPGEQHGDKKDEPLTLSGEKILYYSQDGRNSAFVRTELMHVSEDTKVPP